MGDFIMGYVNDDIFKIKYNSTVDKLQFPKERWLSRLIHKINKHKFISFVIALFCIFSVINFFLIYNLVIVLQNVDFM